MPERSIRYSFLRILTGTDLSRRRLPLMCAEAPAPGPTLWLTAGAHGDEVGGIVVIQEVFALLRRRPLLRGAVCAFPLMNPMGFEAASRHLAVREEDLNRSFPGSPGGTLAERIAHIIFQRIVQTEPALVVDLHNDWIRSVPYVLLDSIDARGNAPARRAARTARQLGGRAGFLLVGDSDDLRRSLSHSLLLAGVPALTLEVGASLVVQEPLVEVGVRAVSNLLAALRMLPRGHGGFQHEYSGAAPRPGAILRYTDRPWSSRSGIVRFLVRPGERVQTGRPVARVYNAFGKRQETLHAVANGVILGLTDSSVAFPGSPLIAMGVDPPGDADQRWM